MLADLSPMVVFIITAIDFFQLFYKKIPFKRPWRYRSVMADLPKKGTFQKRTIQGLAVRGESVFFGTLGKRRLSAATE